MTNYNDGKWHGWNGGDCPVHPDTVVQITYTTGMDTIHVESKFVDWGDGVIAFRVIKEHKEPREFWLFNGLVFSTHEGALTMAHDKPGSIIHVREVLE